MYKAIYLPTEMEIVSLDTQCRSRLDQLRAWDRADQLVCQGCRQPVRLRAGEKRRWHFAHKHREQCSYGNEAPEVLLARAMLYEWLQSKFGKAVTLEKQLAESSLSRPVDVWVETKKQVLAYWVIERSMKPKTRDAIVDALTRVGVSANWILLASVLHPDGQNPDQVILTTTERDFIRRSAYDAIYDQYGNRGTLHYLDAGSKTVTTYRALALVHEPQLYRGHREEHPLSEMQVKPSTGELVHPGEHERLSECKQRLVAEVPLPRPQDSAPAGNQVREFRSSVGDLEQPSVGDLAPVAETARQPRVMPAGTCRVCGRVTTDYWQYSHADQTCVCRDCLRSGKYKINVDHQFPR